MNVSYSTYMTEPQHRQKKILPDLHHLTNNDRAHGTGVVDNSTRRNRALSSGDYEYNLEPLSSAASFQRQSRKRLKMTRRSTMTDFSYSSLPLSQHEQRPRRRSSLASTSSDDFCNISPASSAGNQLDVVIDLHESLTKPPQSHYADEPYNSELVDRRPTYRSRHERSGTLRCPRIMFPPIHVFTAYV